MITERISVPPSKNMDSMYIPLENKFGDNLKESRRFVRKECKVEIICESYNPEKDTFDKTYAVACNHNKEGLFFEANRFFQPDFPIYIRLKDPLKNIGNNELAYGIHAKIIWCDEIADKVTNHRYCIGIEYF